MAAEHETTLMMRAEYSSDPDKSYDSVTLALHEDNKQDAPSEADGRGLMSNENNPNGSQEKGKKKEKFTIWTQVVGSQGTAMVHMAAQVMFGYTGIVLPSLTDPESDDLVLDRQQAAVFVSIITIGSLISCLFAGPLMVKIGQRKIMLIFLPIGVLAWITLSQAHSYILLIAMRFLLGIVVGMVPASSINYVVEISHSTLRGRLMAGTDLCRQIGVLFVFLIGSTGLSWRIVGLICGLSTLIVPFIILLFLPDSPRWLAMHGRFEEARKSLDFFRGEEYDVDSELEAIKSQLAQMSKPSLKTQLQALKEFSVLKRVFIVCFLLSASHLTGNFVMSTYAVVIFESAKTGMNEYISTILTGCVRLVGGVLYILIADKFGRRTLGLFNTSIAGLSLVGLAIYFMLMNSLDDVSHLTWIPLTTILMFNFFFCMAIPIIMLLRGELIPTSVRSLTSGLLDGSYFLGAFLAGISYPPMSDNWGDHAVYFFYAGFCLIIVLVIFFLIPETKGKTLEEIENSFKK